MDKQGWLEKLLLNLPEMAMPMKTFFSISGYPHWENVDSNLLAFYFDATEEHGFDRLFIDSLLGVYKKKVANDQFQWEILDTGYSLKREVVTSKGNRIDILITAKETIEEVGREQVAWAIIIENKINRRRDISIDNPFDDYWDHIETPGDKNKIGILLSVAPLSSPDERFINITHKELIDRVLNKLPDIYLGADQRHLMLLKEYLNHINTYYMATQDMDKILRLFHTHAENIKELIERANNLHLYLSDCIDDVFDSQGFKTKSNRKSSTKNFYIADEQTNYEKDISQQLKKFRFWVNIDRLKYEPVFQAVFELFGEYCRYGDALKTKLREKKIFTENITEGGKGKIDGGYYHIYHIWLPFDDFMTEGLNTKLSVALDQVFFQHKNTFIKQAAEALNSLYERV